MKIAIISDVHNNILNLKKVLNYCKENDIKTIICCGDLASEETLNFLNDNFPGTIHYTFGNMDNDQLKSHLNIKAYKHTSIYKDLGEIEIENKRIAFVHYPETARRLCGLGKYDFVFYGHTHKPWEETIGKCKMLNPGNVAGEIYLPTFAVWNTKNSDFKLIRINGIV